MNYYDEFALRCPHMLVHLILHHDLPPHELTYVAATLGKMQPPTIETSSIVVDLMERLVTHHSEIVREGVVYGLSRHRTTSAISLLKTMASTDPSQTIRDIAQEALED